jgi:hypothetical protein
MKELQKMTWEEWVKGLPRDRRRPYVCQAYEHVSHGLTFDWDKTENDFVATGTINKKVH